MFNLLILLISLYNNAFDGKQKEFNIKYEPIDVVICCHEKDIYSLEICIENVKKYVNDIRRIIVISNKRLTENAEWFDENKMPFSKGDLFHEFSLKDPDFANNTQKKSRVGWYFKQIMNFYAPLIIPGISLNVLILDADVIFTKSIKFIDDYGIAFYSTAPENHIPYFEHMSRFLPGLNRVPNTSGVAHHMIFQKAVLEDLFNLVESYHKLDFWKVYVSMVDINHIASSGAADYEIYFHFLFNRTKQAIIRNLNWRNVTSMYELDFFKNAGYDFLSIHAWSRDPKELEVEAFLKSKEVLDVKDESIKKVLEFAIKYNKPILINYLLNKIPKKDLHIILNIEYLKNCLLNNSKESFIELFKFYDICLLSYEFFDYLLEHYSQYVDENFINLLSFKLKNYNGKENLLSSNFYNISQQKLNFGRWALLKKLVFDN